MLRARFNAGRHPETRRLSPRDHQRLQARMYTAILADWVMWVVIVGVVAMSLCLSAAAVTLLTSKWASTWRGSPYAGLLIPAAAFAPMVAMFIIINRRAPRYIRTGMNALGYPTCVACGYDRTSLDPDALCPECGVHPILAQ